MKAGWRPLLILAHLIIAAAGFYILSELIGIGIVCPGAILVFMIALLMEVTRRFFRDRGETFRWLASLVVLSVCTIAWVVWAFQATRPTTLFREYAADPIPLSVRIIDAKYQGGADDALYLHFSIGATDFPFLLKKRSYVELHGDKANPVQALGGASAPRWWSPDRLTEPSAYQFRTDHEIVEIWTNADRNEVYFVVWHL
ncbi:MAG: hypothetical protein PHU85_14980 [Phycisphaerae bacterium]|nr:hypothetical protein [Phycisphaerae bacterium]